MTCTFFKNRDAPNDTKIKLRALLIDLIEKHGVNQFYVGNHGRFDHIVIRTLRILKKQYPHIRYAVVLAYMPGERKANETLENFETLYPSDMEKTPPKFAIIKRNEWMIARSDYVVTYVKNTFGGAAKFKELSIKNGKKVIEISESF